MLGAGSNHRRGMNMQRWALLGPIAGLVLTGCASADREVGFVFRSTDFGDPCTSDPGNIPRIYDNASSASADVSFKVVNTGGANVFVSGTGFVIPPDGPQKRPRVIRLSVPAGGNIGLEGQASDCAWTATIWPH
jgi:hypothetical protein